MAGFGLAAAATDEGTAAARNLLRRVAAELLVPKTGLFRYVARGLRRSRVVRRADVSTHAFHFASLAGDDWARAIGTRARGRRGAAGSSQGEWPGSSMSNASVTDWYPVYSVHQDAMAALPHAGYRRIRSRCRGCACEERRLDLRRTSSDSR
jgi:hypothetical protein